MGKIDLETESKILFHNSIQQKQENNYYLWQHPRIACCMCNAKRNFVTEKIRVFCYTWQNLSKKRLKHNRLYGKNNLVHYTREQKKGTQRIHILRH